MNVLPRSWRSTKRNVYYELPVALQLSCTIQKDSASSTNRKIKEVQERKQLIETNMFRTKLQRLIEKEQKIKEIVETPKHLRQNSQRNDEGEKDSEREVMTKPNSMKTTYIAKDLPNRSTLLQSLTESQSLVSLRKETILKQLSDDIHQRLEERFQRQSKRNEEISLVNVLEPLLSTLNLPNCRTA